MKHKFITTAIMISAVIVGATVSLPTTAGAVAVNHYTYEDLRNSAVYYDLNMDGVTDSLSANLYSIYSSEMGDNCGRYEFIINGQTYHIADSRHGIYTDVFITDIDQTDTYLDIVLIESYKGESAEIYRYDGNRLIGLTSSATDANGNFFTVWGGYWNAVNNSLDTQPSVQMQVTDSRTGTIGFTFICGGESHSYMKNSALYYSETNGFSDSEYIYSEVKVILNGKILNFEKSPIIQNDRTLVPLRAIFEAMGASVDWDGLTQTVTSTKKSTTIKLTIGSNVLYKNGSAITLDVPAQLIGDYTMVPARAVAEAFDADVSWDGNTRTVYIEN